MYEYFYLLETIVPGGSSHTRIMRALFVRKKTQWLVSNNASTWFRYGDRWPQALPVISSPALVEDVDFQLSWRSEFHLLLHSHRKRILYHCDHALANPVSCRCCKSRLRLNIKLRRPTVLQENGKLVTNSKIGQNFLPKERPMSNSRLLKFDNDDDINYYKI